MIPKIKNRRDFLKEIGVYAGSTAFLTTIPWLNAFAQENGKNNAASDRVRIAVIGIGLRGKAIILNLKEIENVEIVAACDNYEPHYQRAIEMTEGKARVFYDYKKLLDDVKNIDGVVIATPLHEHARMTVDFLNAGVHVLCEKSMALTLEDTKLMVDTSQATGKILQIGHQRMFNPVYLNALERIRAGKIGKINLVKNFWEMNHDWRRPMPGPEFERIINWRMYTEYSGGLMTELVTHQIQVANWFLDQVPSRVVGSGSISFWKDGREVYDNVAAIYDYPDGAKCICDSMLANRHYGMEEQILGNLGTIEPEVNRIYSENRPDPPGLRQLIHNIESSVFEVIPIGGATWLPETVVKDKGEIIAPYDNDDLFLQMVGFVKAIKAGKPYPNLLREGYHASVAVLLGLQAMDRNETVTWPSEYYMEKEA